MQHIPQESALPEDLGAPAPSVSVVIPMHNEEGAVPALIAGIAQAAADLPAFEIIAVDDGSSDRTYDELC